MPPAAGKRRQQRARAFQHGNLRGIQKARVLAPGISQLIGFKNQTVAGLVVIGGAFKFWREGIVGDVARKKGFRIGKRILFEHGKPGATVAGEGGLFCNGSRPY